jgi:hypothetical protein
MPCPAGHGNTMYVNDSLRQCCECRRFYTPSKENNMQSIILHGNIFDGFDFHGPFEDHDAAIEWAEQQKFDHEWLVATLNAPTN